MPLPALLTTLLAGGAGAYGGNKLIQSLKQKPDPYATLKTIGAVGGGGLLAALLAKALMKKREQPEAEADSMPYPMPSSGGGDGVNISFSPVLSQLLGSQNRKQDQLIIPDGGKIAAEIDAKEMVKTAFGGLGRLGQALRGLGGGVPGTNMRRIVTPGGLNKFVPETGKAPLWRRMATRAGKSLIDTDESLNKRFLTRSGDVGPGSMLGGLMGRGRGLGGLGRMLIAPVRWGAGAAGRLSGIAPHMARRRVGRAISGEDAKFLNEAYDALRGAGWQRPKMMPSMGVGSPRSAAQLQEMAGLTRRDPKTGLMTAFSDEAEQLLAKSPGFDRERLLGIMNQRTGSGQSLHDLFRKSQVRGTDALLPAGLGAGAGAAYAMAPGDTPVEEVGGGQNFLQQGMGEIGDFVGGQGFSGIGDWIKQNPYMSAGLGGGGILALIMMLMQMFGNRR